jgi:hypothetical protein
MMLSAIGFRISAGLPEVTITWPRDHEVQLHVDHLSRYSRAGTFERQIRVKSHLISPRIG